MNRITLTTTLLWMTFHLIIFLLLKERSVFPSAISMYYAPSDKSGIRGMFRECIRAVDSWRKGPGRHDTVFLSGDPGKEGFLGLLVARVRLFMSVVHNKVTYPCALVSWFSTVGDLPCPDTGMWNRAAHRTILRLRPYNLRPYLCIFPCYPYHKVIL
jgi:hypothetical protein